MRGIVISEQAQTVPLIPPKDITGGAVGQRFNMKYFRKASILLMIGVSANAPTKLLVKGCTDKNGLNAEAIGYSLYKCETPNDDKLGVREAVTAAGYTPSANDNIFYRIEIDAMDLPDDKPWVEFSVTNGANSVIAAAVATLSSPSYEGSNIGISALV